MFTSYLGIAAETASYINLFTPVPRMYYSIKYKNSE